MSKKLSTSKSTNFEVEMTRELKNFVKPFGFATHQAIHRKFVTYCKITSSKFATSYKSYTYKNDNGVDVESFLMTEEFSMGFAVFCDPERGLEFIAKLAKQDKLLLADKEREILQLTSDLATAKAKVVYTNTKFNRVSRHKELMDLVSSGVLDVSTYQVTHRKYTVTAYGLQLGYFTNDNGTVIQP